MTGTSIQDGLTQAEARTRAWVQGAVIELNLCPFAHGPWGAGRVAVVVTGPADFEEAVEATLTEVRTLVTTSTEVLSSTLVVFERGLEAFEDFLDAMDAVHAVLDESGAFELVQIAHFHPDYRFEGEDESAPGNYTNRSPYPTCHLLRVQEVERAIGAHGDSLQIPDDNIARLSGLGAEALGRLWAAWGATAPVNR